MSLVIWASVALVAALAGAGYQRFPITRMSVSTGIAVAGSLLAFAAWLRGYGSPHLALASCAVAVGVAWEFYRQKRYEAGQEAVWNLRTFLAKE